MLIVVYHTQAKLVPSDHRVQLWVNNCIDSYKKYCLTGDSEYIYVNSNMQVMAFRIAIIEGRISHQDIMFKYKKQEIHPDANARLPEWPVGFCDVLNNMLMKLMEPFRVR